MSPTLTDDKKKSDLDWAKSFIEDQNKDDDLEWAKSFLEQPKAGKELKPIPIAKSGDLSAEPFVSQGGTYAPTPGEIREAKGPPANRTFFDALNEQWGTKEGLVRKVPWIGTGVEIKDLYTVYEAAKRAEGGKASKEDWQLLQAYEDELKKRASQESSVGAMAVDIFSESLPFMAEFITSGGILAVAKKGAKKGAKKQLSRSIRKAIDVARRKGLRKPVVGGVASGLARLPFFSHRVAETTVRRMVPDFVIKEGEGQDMHMVVANQGEPLNEALKNAAVDTYIEIYSETLGKPIGAIVGKGLRKAGFEPLRASAERLLKGMGYHGVIGEMTEERMGEALRELATQTGAVDLPQQLPTGKQLAAEAMAFSVPGVAGRVLGGPQPPTQPLQETPTEPVSDVPPTVAPEPLPTVYDAPKDRVLTPGGASALVAQDPTVAEALAKTEGTVTRTNKAFVEFRKKHSERKWSEDERNKLRDLVRDAWGTVGRETAETVTPNQERSVVLGKDNDTAPVPTRPAPVRFPAPLATEAMEPDSPLEGAMRKYAPRWVRGEHLDRWAKGELDDTDVMDSISAELKAKGKTASWPYEAREELRRARERAEQEVGVDHVPDTPEAQTAVSGAVEDIPTEPAGIQDTGDEDVPAVPVERVEEPEKPFVRKGLKKAKADVLAIYDQYKDVIHGEDPDMMSAEGPTDSDHRSGYSFKASSANKSLVDEIKRKLPEGLEGKVKLVQAGKPAWSSADGADVHSRLDTDAMVESIIRFAERDTGVKQARATLDFMRENPQMFTPEQHLAANNYEMLHTAEIPIERIKEDELKPGDQFEIEGHKHTAATKLSDGGTLVKNDIDMVVPPGGEVLADKDSLKKGAVKPKDLFGKPEGEMAGRLFGEAQPTVQQAPLPTLPEGPTESEVDQKIRRKFSDVEATEDLFPFGANVSDAAKKARKDLSDELDDLGNYMQGKLFANPLDPELVRRVSRIVAKAVKAGALSFADVVNHVANRIGSELTRRIGPAMKEEWEKLRKDNDKLTPTADVEEILAQREGRPELANPATAEPARELVRDVDEAREEQGVPKERHDEPVFAEATARLEANYAGERAKLVAVARAGGQLNDVETVMAKRILNRESQEAIRSGDADRVAEAMALIDAYRRTGTEQARAFRQRRDPVETPEQRAQRTLGEALLTPPKGKTAEEWVAQIPDVKKKLEAMGVDADNLEEVSKDPIKASQALHTIQAAKADVWDAAYEFWRNSILSSPLTQAANIIGNTTHSMWHFTAERFAEALVNTFAKQQTGAQWGEFKHMLAGVLPGLSRGMQNLLKSWKAEIPFFEAEVGRAGVSKIEDKNIAISGLKGRIIRMPQRMLLAADEMYKTLFAEMEVGVQAYRIAKAEGLEGDALRQRIHELSIDHESKAWDAAIALARELTFQEQKGVAIPGILKVRRDWPGLRYLIPFVTTPWNIFKLGLRKSPYGTLRLAHKTYKGVKTGNWDGITRNMAEQLIAWGIVLALLGNDEDDPWITGTVSEYDRGGRRLSRRTYPSQSIKIGDTWYSYARIEPFATTVGTIVDWLGAIKSGQVKRIVSTPLTSLVGQVKNKTFLSGLSDFLRALEGEAPEEKLARWAASFATSWIPNLARSTGRATQDVYPERGVWGDGPEWLSRLMRRTLERTELGFVPSYPSIDIWGREAPRPVSPAPHTDFLWRMFVPSRTRREDVTLGDRILVNWNNQNPEDERFPGPPRKYFTVQGKRRWLNEAEYRQFMELSGKKADDLVGKWLEPGDAANPKERDIKQVTRAIEKGRALAKSRLLYEWKKNPDAASDPDLVQAILDEWTR